jgi:hypothetical protein
LTTSGVARREEFFICTQRFCDRQAAVSGKVESRRGAFKHQDHRLPLTKPGLTEKLALEYNQQVIPAKGAAEKANA